MPQLGWFRMLGPFEDFGISEDIYATFYLLARNATPDLYSISPFKNPDVPWLLDLALGFKCKYVLVSWP